MKTLRIGLFVWVMASSVFCGAFVRSRFGMDAMVPWFAALCGVGLAVFLGALWLIRKQRATASRSRSQ